MRKLEEEICKTKKEVELKEDAIIQLADIIEINSSMQNRAPIAQKKKNTAIDETAHN
jgi:hypothetical protein